MKGARSQRIAEAGRRCLVNAAVVAACFVEGCSEQRSSTVDVTVHPSAGRPEPSAVEVRLARHRQRRNMTMYTNDAVGVKPRLHPEEALRAAQDSVEGASYLLEEFDRVVVRFDPKYRKFDGEWQVTFSPSRYIGGILYVGVDDASGRASPVWGGN